jgi:excinuclease ABC subunit A
MFNEIYIQGARLHNLKNISLRIPKYKLVVFTGLSGSGKSSLVFDTIHKEGQRQYLESLGLVTDDLIKPAMDAISGLSPSISIDQHLTNRNPRSTVGTATEIFTYLRVLYARIGRRICPKCGNQVLQQYEEDDQRAYPDIHAEEESGEGKSFACSVCGYRLPELNMANFSFNKPEGACPTCMGLGTIHQPVLENLMDVSMSIPQGAIKGWDAFYIQHYSKTLQAASKHYQLDLDLEKPIEGYTQEQKDLLLYGVESDEFTRHFPGYSIPDAVQRGRFEGIATNIIRRYTEQAHDEDYREKLADLVVSQTCPTCEGTRLCLATRQVTIQSTPITSLTTYSLEHLKHWLEVLPKNLTLEEVEISKAILIDIDERLEHLLEVGVGYLSMERATATLSGGEAQRLRMASLLGSGLTGVVYVMDEPTLGLHPRDTKNLLKFILRLRDLGNSMLVIEHDLEVFKQADYLIDIGPGAGKDGGMVVAAGTPQQVAQMDNSITGRYLSGLERIPRPDTRHPRRGEITIFGAAENNLKQLDVKIPLGVLVAVTGVSGSGKSSLIIDILQKAASRKFNNSRELPGQYDRIEGWQYLDKIISVDQAAIGRMPRSNAATYTGTFDVIRAFFAALPEARKRHLKENFFSFNTPNGACPACKGSGLLTVKMHFLPDTSVRCPRCRGKRYKDEILAIHYQDESIADILEMTIREALNHFRAVSSIAEKLQLLEDVGLGYLQLGQPATTLSGGEAQRVKLAKELSRKASGKTLYLLDEPTMGLHPADIANLTILLQRLVESGNSVVVIEHNLELIQAADWMIDLGPEGGDAGGMIVAEGTPEQVSWVAASHTGQALLASGYVKGE